MLKVTASNVVEVSNGIWVLSLPPHQVRMFGRCESVAGSRSILLLGKAEFDATSGNLVFAVEDATALNIGKTTETVALLLEMHTAAAPNHQPIKANSAAISRGDRQFLDLCRDLFDAKMQKAAEALLAGVRARAPGELKRGLSRNFSETPDNFWYVIVQPRVQELSITVRGPVKLFEGLTHLPVKDDRGNTLFKVKGEQDVDAALKLIFAAKRKF